MHGKGNHRSLQFGYQFIGRETDTKCCASGVERGRLSDLALTEPIEDVLGKWKLTIGTQTSKRSHSTLQKKLACQKYMQFTMRLARFQGIDKNEFIDNQRVEGNIFVLLNEAMNFFPQAPEYAWEDSRTGT